MASKKQTTLTMMTFGKPASAGFQLFTLCAILFNSLLIASGQDTLYAGDLCTLRDNTRGICTTAAKCPWFIQTIVKNKRYNERVNCGFDGAAEIICCKETGKTPTTVPSKFTAGLRTRMACDRIPEVKTRLTFHIVDGVEAEEGEFPFVAALGYTPDMGGTEYDYRCGASLISENFLVTAAHCIPKQDRPVVALLGTNNLARGNHGIQVKIKEFYPHPEYRTTRSYNDIALIQLEHGLHNEPGVHPICIYHGTEDLPEGMMLTAEGFGITDVDRQLRSVILMKVNLTTITLKTCNNIFVENNLLTHNRRLPQGLIDTQYCAAGRENLVSKLVGDTCQGDSGGPMQIVDNDKYKLVGITSFGNGCGTSLPSVYTRVSRFVEWIESIVWPNGTR